MDQQQSTSFWAFVKEVPDSRQARGQRYAWRYLLALLCAALLSGQLTGSAMAEWVEWHAAEIAQALREQLQIVVRRTPSASTLRRALRKVDIAALEQQMARFAQRLDALDPVVGRIQGADGQPLRGQAVDGKEVRGAGRHGHKVHLVSLVRHEQGTLLGQQQVADQSNEIVAAPQLLKGRDLQGTVTTTDALNTQQKLAEQIIGQGGDYLMVVKDNQPTLYGDIQTYFATPALPLDEDERQTHISQGKGHGRLETRTLICSTGLRQYLNWPGAQQVLQRTCERQHLKSGKVERETSYAVTSLSRERAQAPQLEVLWRGHWTIENQEHYVRDETLREDRCQIWVGHAPQALAALKNGILAALRYQGWVNIAQALRYYGASPARALAFLAQNAT
jgi:predicted transposase YbfD/YdcC